MPHAENDTEPTTNGEMNNSTPMTNGEKPHSKVLEVSSRSPTVTACVFRRNPLHYIPLHWLHLHDVHDAH